MFLAGGSGRLSRERYESDGGAASRSKESSSRPSGRACSEEKEATQRMREKNFAGGEAEGRAKGSRLFFLKSWQDHIAEASPQDLSIHPSKM